jgi:hypothetical protein
VQKLLLAINYMANACGNYSPAELQDIVKKAIAYAKEKGYV